MCVHAKVYMWRSEDNLLESIHTWDPEIKLRSPVLAAITVTGPAILMALNCYFCPFIREQGSRSWKFVP